MGMLVVTTNGSFGPQTKVFAAMENGHAHAVAQTIAWLSTEVLPKAIEQDHRLHEEGSKPLKGFDRPI